MLQELSDCPSDCAKTDTLFSTHDDYQWTRDSELKSTPKPDNRTSGSSIATLVVLIALLLLASVEDAAGDAEMLTLVNMNVK